MSTVQPITPYQPSTSVLLAVKSAPDLPVSPTNQELISTIQPLPYSTYGGTTQLPGNISTALISQQAVVNANLSSQEKISKGVLDTTAGATLGQVSTPGQLMKPGSGDFVRQLQEANPDLPFYTVASDNLMTGNSGVSTTDGLLRNNQAQVAAVNNSLQVSMSVLKNNGAITGYENPTQIAGVVMAGATTDPQAVAETLKSPTVVQSAVGGQDNPIGQAIANGNYAAGIADANFSGLAGVAASVSYAQAPEQSFSQTSLMQNAFSLVESSYKDLKPGQVNDLSGENADQEKVSGTLSAALQVQTAKDDLAAAETELVSARKTYYMDSSQENYATMRLAESKVAAATQRVAQGELKLTSQQTNTAGSYFSVPNSLISGGVEDSSGDYVITGTGINALPGGVNAFAAQIGSAGSNIFDSVKNILSGAGSVIEGGISSITSGASSLIDAIKTRAGGLSSSIYSSISSIGNAPGQIKTATLATNTNSNTNAVVAATLNATLDPKVPPPNFDEVVPSFSPDEYQRAQVDAQLALNELLASRAVIEYKIDNLVEKYQETGQTSLINDIDGQRKELAQLDIKILAAQKTYERIVSSQ